MRLITSNGRLTLLSLAIVALASGWAAADSNSTYHRDRSYEQALRYEASADQAITPAKVIRWMLQRQGRKTGAPSATEFVPIVNVHDSKVRLIAAIAYKF